MKKMLCILWLDGQPAENHYFTLPDIGEDGFYRDTTSFNAYHNSEAKRFYAMYIKNEYPPIRGHAQYVTEHHYINHTLSKFQHNSIWELYKAIGYDYKKKKYTTMKGTS